MPSHSKVSEGNSKVKVTYERLRKLAVGEDRQVDSVKWLQILECGAMMRDTAEDVIMDHLKDIRGMFEMNCLFLSGDFKFHVSPKVFISCPRSTPRG